MANWPWTARRPGSLGQAKVRFVKADYGKSSQAISPERQCGPTGGTIALGDDGATTTASPLLCVSIMTDKFIR
jgi:hypothetical protein